MMMNRHGFQETAACAAWSRGVPTLSFLSCRKSELGKIWEKFCLFAHINSWVIVCNNLQSDIQNKVQLKRHSAIFT